jgi:hypothetical protein
MIPTRDVSHFGSAIAKSAGKTAYSLMNVQFPEDFCSIKKMLVVHDPSGSVRTESQSVELRTYFFTFQTSSGKFSIKAIQYPLMRKRTVRNPWTAASGMM